MPESYGVTAGVTIGADTLKAYYGAPGPVGRITVKVVLLKAGHVGQVLVDGVIVRELKPRKTHHKADQAARDRVARRLAASL